MLLIKPRTVRRKLLLVMLATTFTALLVTGTAMVMYELRTYERSWINDLTAQAEILGRASAAALAFEDPKAARENLLLLQAKPRIAAAAIYTAKGALFASYTAGALSNFKFPGLPESDGYRIDGDELVLFKRIVDNNEIAGTVYLQGRYNLTQRLRDYLAILGSVLILSLLIALAMSSWLHTAVTKPILDVTSVARQVMESRNFTLRARKSTEDEIGYLVDAFNDMLSEVGRRAVGLEESNRVLQHEIAERRGAEDALRVSERRNRTLVAATTSVVWAADGRGRFTEEQPSWQDYTGQTREQYQGVGWHDAFHESDRAAIDLAWARAVNTATVFDLELGLWHPQSERHRAISLRAVPVVESNGEIREWIGTVTDIDDQRHAEDEFRRLNSELEKRVESRTAELETANKDLESFSYSVSHDLRAPVRAIVGFSRMLWDQANQLDDEGRRKLDIIRSEGARMGVLIDELLAFSRLGRQPMRMVELDMGQMAGATYERLRTQHEGIHPEFRLGALPRTNGDRVLLEQVWTNFLSNALKFTAKKEQPLIEVGAITDDKEHVYFVRDNGAGFDPRYQEKLFGVFQRLHNANEFQGTGVGLALVHRIVTRHGGRVWAEGKLGEGATFYFTLPKEQSSGSV